MSRRVALVMALATVWPASAAAQTAGGLLRGAGEGALLGAAVGAGGWAGFCAAVEPDDDLDPPVCALWGAAYQGALGALAGLGLAADDAATAWGRLRIVGLGSAAGLGAGAVVALAAGGDYGAVPLYGALGLGSGLVVAAVGPWLHRRLGSGLAVTPSATGLSVRLSVR